MELGRHTRMLGRPRRYNTQAMAFLISSVWMRGLLAAVALTLGAAAGCCACTPPVAPTSLALSVAHLAGLQPTTSASTCGSCCTHGCWAMTWTLG